MAEIYRSNVVSNILYHLILFRSKFWHIPVRFGHFGQIPAKVGISIPIPCWTIFLIFLYLDDIFVHFKYT